MIEGKCSIDLRLLDADSQRMKTQSQQSSRQRHWLEQITFVSLAKKLCGYQNWTPFFSVMLYKEFVQFVDSAAALLIPEFLFR